MPKKTARKSRGPRKKLSQRGSGGNARSAGKGPTQEDGQAPPPDVGPFDGQFFRSQFANLLRPEGEAPKSSPHQPYLVTVVLGDGMVQLEIVRIEDLSEQWALFEVYESPGRRDRSAPSRYVFVPYAAIARVEVTGSESRAAPMGFHRKPPEKKAVRKKAVRKKAARKKVVRKKATAQKTPRKQNARDKRA